MRYLGGGVGHREQGMSVARSRQHASRIKRTGRICLALTAGWHTITNTQKDFDTSMTSDAEDTDTDSEGEDSAMEGSDSSSDGFPDNDSNGSEESEDSTTDFYAMIGLRRRDRAPSNSPDEDGQEDGAVDVEWEDKEAHHRGIEDDGDELGSVDGRTSDYGVGDEKMAENVENDEDYHMDYEYEAEGFARL